MCWEDVLRCLRFGHWDHRSNQVAMHAAQRRLLRIWLIWFYSFFFLVYDSLRLEVSPLVFLSYCWTNIQYTFVTFVAQNFQIQNACWENHVGFSCWKHNTKLCFYSARGSWVTLDANLLMFKNIILDLTVIPAINSWTVAMLNSHCFWPNHRADPATECQTCDATSNVGPSIQSSLTSMHVVVATVLLEFVLLEIAAKPIALKWNKNQPCGINSVHDQGRNQSLPGKKQDPAHEPECSHVC